MAIRDGCRFKSYFIARVEDREKEMESLLKLDNEERAGTVKGLQDLLDYERKAHQEANRRVEDLSRQLEGARTKVDILQRELTSVRLNETALDNKLKTVSHTKRLRTDDDEIGVGSGQGHGTNDCRQNKRSCSTTSPLKYTIPEDGGSVFKGDDNHSQQTDQEDCTKFTVQKLKQELTKYNFDEQLLQLRNPNKEIVALYEKCIIQKS